MALTYCSKVNNVAIQLRMSGCLLVISKKIIHRNRFILEQLQICVNPFIIKTHFRHLSNKSDFSEDDDDSVKDKSYSPPATENNR